MILECTKLERGVILMALARLAVQKPEVREDISGIARRLEFHRIDELNFVPLIFDQVRRPAKV